MKNIDNSNSNSNSYNNNKLTSASTLLLFLLLMGCTGLTLGTCLGSTGFEASWFSHNDLISNQIVWEIRLPRSIGAWLAGALLGLSGALAQGLFRNPLADPYLLGSASGASLCVAIMMVMFDEFSNPWLYKLGLNGAAFLGAMIAVLFTLLLARGMQHTLRLLLAGVIVGVVLGALTSLVTIFYPELLSNMQSFMLGTTNLMNWSSVYFMAPVLLLCIFVSWILSRAVDSMGLGEATAISLGVNLGLYRALLILTLALATGVSVAQAGLISFVGLASPHLVRSIVNVTFKKLMFFSALMGGVMLLFADLASRLLISPREIPVGLLTAVFGGLYLIWLLSRHSVSNVNSNSNSNSNLNTSKATNL